MRCVKRHYKTLRAICKSKAQKRKQILQNASGDVIRSVSQVIKNTLKGNVPVSQRQKDRLRRHKQVLRQLSLKRTSLKKKRNILIQKGGALLPLLLTPILSAVAGSLFN